MHNKKEMTGYPSIDRPWLKYYSDEAINIKLPECSIYEYILEKNKDNGHKPAMNYFGNRIKYKSMFEAIDNTADALYSIGIRADDRVAMCMLTMPETVYSVYALNKIGAVCNMIEPRTNAELIKQRINACRSRVLIVVDVFLPKVMSIVDGTALEKKHGIRKK